MYLFVKNLKTRKLSKKLNHVKVESFLVKKTKKLINYELDLLKKRQSISSILYFIVKISEFNYVFIEHILFSFTKRETI